MHNHYRSRSIRRLEGVKTEKTKGTIQENELENAILHSQCIDECMRKLFDPKITVFRYNIYDSVAWQIKTDNKFKLTIGIAFASKTEECYKFAEACDYFGLELCGVYPIQSKIKIANWSSFLLISDPEKYLTSMELLAKARHSVLSNYSNLNRMLYWRVESIKTASLVGTVPDEFINLFAKVTVLHKKILKNISSDSGIIKGWKKLVEYDQRGIVYDCARYLDFDQFYDSVEQYRFQIRNLVNIYNLIRDFINSLRIPVEFEKIPGHNRERLLLSNRVIDEFTNALNFLQKEFKKHKIKRQIAKMIEDCGNLLINT